MCAMHTVGIEPTLSAHPSSVVFNFLNTKQRLRLNFTAPSYNNNNTEEEEN